MPIILILVIGVSDYVIDKYSKVPANSNGFRFAVFSSIQNRTYRIYLRSSKFGEVAVFFPEDELKAKYGGEASIPISRLKNGRFNENELEDLGRLILKMEWQASYICNLKKECDLELKPQVEAFDKASVVEIDSLKIEVWDMTIDYKLASILSKKLHEMVVK